MQGAGNRLLLADDNLLANARAIQLRKDAQIFRTKCATSFKTVWGAAS